MPLYKGFSHIISKITSTITLTITSAISLTLILAVLFFSGTRVSAKPFPPDMATISKTHAIEAYQQAKKRSPYLDAPEPIKKMPLGTNNALVLLVDFKDQVGRTDPNLYENILFSEGTYSTGSMRDYFQEISYNHFDIDGNVNGTIGNPPEWFRMDVNYSYYCYGQYGWGAYPHNTQKLAEDAVRKADAYVDYSLYDNTGDGVVDSLFIVYAGRCVFGDPDFIWPHKWQMEDPNIELDGMRFSAYTVISEYEKDPNDNDSTIGVYCHQYGHVLGLPSLYDQDLYPDYYISAGIGRWGLMGYGMYNGAPAGSSPAHPCAWSKIRLGWALPKVILGNQSVIIHPAETKDYSIFQLWTKGIVGAEYFLVENRQKKGFDKALPGSGLLIYHVDETMLYEDNPAIHPIDVEQADGKYELNYGDSNNAYGDAGDPWPGDSDNTTFDKHSIPNTWDNYNKDTLVAVKNINESDPNASITAYLYVNDCNAPAIDFCATPRAGTASLRVAFTTFSTGGEVTNWFWNFGDTIISTENNPKHIYTTAGNYTVSLTAAGPGGENTETKIKYITVYNPPVANAGPDQTVEETSTEEAIVNLDGSKSYDPNELPLIYKWTWDSKSITGKNPTITLPVGTTTVTLKVDNVYYVDSDTVVITVVQKNDYTIAISSPVAEAGPDQTVEKTSYNGASVNLDGSQSYDPNSLPLTYTWTWDSKSATGINPEVILPVGATSITLTVDNGYFTSTDTVVITVEDIVKPVITNLTASPDIVSAGNAYKMVDVDLTCDLAYKGAIAPTCRITEVDVDYPDESNMWFSRLFLSEYIITGDMSLKINSKCKPRNFADKIFTITVECTDASGNSDTDTTTVIVTKGFVSENKWIRRIRRRPAIR